jgi:hypothetical protein
MTLLVTRRARRNSGRSSKRPSSRLKARTGYPAETREEALAGTLRDDKFKDASLSFIRYRGVREDLDSRDYFLNLARKFVPEVKRQIRSQRLTPQFAKDWGVVTMCHGFISAHILDDSDGLSHFRAGRKWGKTRSKYPQKKWMARQILAIMETGLTRGQADARLGTRIAEFAIVENSSRL